VSRSLLSVIEVSSQLTHPRGECDTRWYRITEWSRPFTAGARRRELQPQRRPLFPANPYRTPQDVMAHPRAAFTCVKPLRPPHQLCGDSPHAYDSLATTCSHPWARSTYLVHSDNGQCRRGKKRGACAKGSISGAEALQDVGIRSSKGGAHADLTVMCSSLCDGEPVGSRSSSWP
jgi:hypothetical protein